MKEGKKLLVRTENNSFSRTTPPSGQPTDAELVKKLRAGDKRAFDQLYQRYEKPLFLFIQRYLKNPEEAEEVFHEVFMKVLNHKSVDYLDESVRGWLYVTARNMSLNRIRKRQRTYKVHEKLTQLDEVTEKFDLEEKKIEQDLTERVLNKSQRLSKEQQKMLQLRLSGLSNKEIAEIENLPEGTVKSRFHSIISYLKKGFYQ